MTFDKLQPGTIVYDVQKQRMGNTTMPTVSVYEVRIISVDAEKQTVVASWNNNRPQTYTFSRWSKWRVKRPALITGMCGSKRIAKRGEVEK